MKKVVVTGGTGFIGSWLVRELLQHQIEVIVLVRNVNTGKFSEVKNKNKLRLVQYDTEDMDALEHESGMIDAFYHLAWDGVSTEEKNDAGLQLENIHLSIKMLEFARQEALRRHKEYMRLDCRSERVKLRAVYEGFGFSFVGLTYLIDKTCAKYEIRL